MESKVLAAAAAFLSDEKKAEDVKVFEVGDQFQIADFAVVVTGNSRPHVKAIYDELHVRLKATGEQHRPVEGADLGWWILLDYGNVIVHILQPDAREYYDLESLYSDCAQMDWPAVELPEIADPILHRRGE